MKKLLVVLFVCVLSACASQIMQSYIGQPVQAIMLDYGAPSNAFDMPDKTRVFQWSMSTSYITPINVHTTGNVNTLGSGTAIGNSFHGSANSWMNSNTQITGGQTYNNNCVYSMFTKWNEKDKTWYVTGFKAPKLMCE